MTDKTEVEAPAPTQEGRQMSDVAETLTKTLRRAEDGAGTLPVKEAVKLRPADWHAVTRDAREAAAEITDLRAQLAAVESAMGRGAERFMFPPDGGDPTLAEMVGNMRQQLDAAEAALAKAEAFKLTVASLKNQLTAESERAGRLEAASRALRAQLASAVKERDEARARFNDIDLCKMGQAPCNALLAAEAESDRLRRALDEAVKTARSHWLADNDPNDGTDCVSPYDHLLYRAMLAAVPAAPPAVSQD
jgi:chromosome segregation ATPase